METHIDKLTQLGTEAVQSAISHYTHWFVVSAICWLVLGLVCAILSIVLWRKRTEWQEREKSDSFMEYAGEAAVFLMVIAVITLPMNIPTLLQPRAYAIHQLITDASK